MIWNRPAEGAEKEPGVLDRVRQAVGIVAGSGDPVQERPASETIHRFQRVEIIINPSSGPGNGPDLSLLNKVLHELELDWEISITRRGGDARDYTRKAIAAGVDAVAVYGGDGTVLEVAGALAGSEVPLVLLPGGTANVLSLELGIPRELARAALLLGGAPNAIRALDMGAFTQAGEAAPHHPLFFHLGLGLEGRLHEVANREAKERSGMFAYVTSALRTLTSPAVARYHLLLDGEPVEVDGVDLMITTYGSTGLPGVTLSRAIDVSDGLLDVIVIENANIASILSAAVGAVTAGELARPLLQWQAREITVVADPPQPLAVDGELMAIGPGPVSVHIVPQAVRVVVPAQAAPAGARREAA